MRYLADEAETSSWVISLAEITAIGAPFVLLSDQIGEIISLNSYNRESWRDQCSGKYE
jgi:hypothetical protein